MAFFPNGLVEISGAVSFLHADSTSRLVTPKSIQINELAANEGLLVTVQNVQLVNKSFVFYPNNTEQITDGTTQADLRIDGDTNIPGLAKPQGPVNITGVVGRFNTNAQLMPRSSLDIPGAAVPETPADSIPHTATFDLMNWNLEFFGAQREDYPDEYGPADEPLQRDNVAKVIINQDPDVVAVQEVSNDSIFSTLIAKLPGYRSICSPRWSHDFDDDGTFPPQKVCYIYDTTTVKVISHRPMFAQLFDAARAGHPELLPGIPGGDASSFFASGRLPFLMTADVTINGVTERINFIDIHAKSGGDEDSRVRRGYDLQVLKDSLDANFSNAKFVILGDLNDDLDESIVPGQPSPYAEYVADSANYSPITKALSDAGAKSTLGFNDVIDHQILSNELDSLYIDGSVRIFAPFTLIPNYGTTTSDHLPVLSRFTFPQPEPEMPSIGFAEAEISIVEGSGKHTIVLKVTEPLPFPQSVTISATNGPDLFYGPLLDYVTKPALRPGNKITLNIPPNAMEISFDIHPNKDVFRENEETVTFTIASVTSGLNIGIQSTVKVHIEDLVPCVPIFIVYPNPTFGPVNIWTPEYNENEIVHGTLYDQHGNVLQSLDGTAAQLGDAFTTALHGKRNGIYVLKLVQCDQTFTYRILKL